MPGLRACQVGLHTAVFRGQLRRDASAPLVRGARQLSHVWPFGHTPHVQRRAMQEIDRLDLTCLLGAARRLGDATGAGAS